MAPQEGWGPRKDGALAGTVTENVLRVILCEKV